MSLAPCRTLRDLLLSGGSPSSIALSVVDSGARTVSLSRSSLSAAVEKVGWELKTLGVSRGDAVSIAMENTAEYIICFLAVTWIRAIAAPLNPRYKKDELVFFMDDVKSKILIVGSGFSQDCVDAAEERRMSLVCVTDLVKAPGKDEVTLAEVVRGEELIPPPQSATWTWDLPQPTDVALFLHTSGTTSRPKLVPLSHHNLCTSMGNIRNTYELDEKDTIYLVMPLFHVHGLVGGLFSTLCSGGTVVLPAAGKFSASVFWKDVVTSGVTWYTAVPTIHQILLRRKEEDKELIAEARLRFIRSCSSPLAPATFHAIEETFGSPVLEAYAMSEAAHQMTSNPLPKNGPRKPGTVGRAMNVQVCILNDQNDRIDEPGKVGHVCIRGESVTTGYFNRPQANIEDFAGGFFHTGDQGFLDSDGYLTLTGRLKELINRGGEKISPIEIDSVMLSHPDIAEAVSFAGPNEKYGEEVCIAVVPKTGKQLTEASVTEFAKGKLAPEKLPTKIFITDEVPKTATGKVQRRFVKAKFIPENSKL